MKFTFRLYLVAAKPGDEPILKPLTLNLPSAEAARSHALKVAASHLVKGEVAIQIDSEDGTVSERWAHVNGPWAQLVQK